MVLEQKNEVATCRESVNYDCTYKSQRVWPGKRIAFYMDLPIIALRVGYRRLAMHINRK